MKTLALLTIALGLSAQGAQITLSASPGLAPAGTSVTLTISLVTGGGPAAVQWDMTGVPVGTTVTTAVAGKTIQCTTTVTRCVLSGMNAAAIPDGIIAQLQYSQPATAPTEGISATLGASPVGALVALTPATASRCDLNADGKVDATDIGLAITQVLAAVTNGQPTAVDIVRIIIAALGGVCLR